MYHQLLRKQIEKHLPAAAVKQEGMEAFLASINDSYGLFERDREVMDHAYSVSETEIEEVNHELHTLSEQRQRTLKELNETVRSLRVGGSVGGQQENLVALSEKIKHQVRLNRITEDQLSINVNLFKTLLGNLRSGFLVENEHREILFTNQLFCDYFSIPAEPDQLIGMDCTESAQQAKALFAEPEKFVAGAETLLRERKPMYNERLKTADGRVFERDYVPIFVEELYRGHFWKYTDITNEVLYRQILRESEERNRMVMNSSLDAIVIADNAGVIRYWNPRAEQLFGWSLDEADGLPLETLFARAPHGAESSGGGEKYLQQGITEVLNEMIEVTAVTKRRGHFPVELIVVTYEQNGKTFYCGFMKDISSRKKAENRLKAQEKKYRNIIDNMNLGLVEVDVTHHILFVNQRFCEISGFTPEEVLDRQSRDMLIVENRDFIQQRQRDLEAQEQSKSYEIAVRNKHGERKWWFISAAPNYNEEGTLLGSVYVILDITSQKDLEVDLAISKTKAEEASIAKEAFLANMSHEIRTPLNAIIGMIRELSREQLTAQQKTYLSHTDTAARHLLSIINSILDISKIEAGELELDNHDFSLEAVVANLRSILFIKAAKQGLDLSCNLSPDLWPAHRGDSSRIRQVLINLLGNAIKFTMEGYVHLDITVLSEDPTTQLIRIEISDTGVGMDPAYLDRLFSKFSQEERSTSRRFGGTGLGMPITKEIVTLMEGNIAVKSEKGKGTQFTIELRLQRGDVQALTLPATNSAHLLGGTHVLLVEDNVMNRFIATKCLSHFGCTVEEAENGQVALERLAQRSYDLVLMDIQMPVLDGLETTKVIRNQLQLEVPIIAVTANAFKKDIDLYLSLGMNDYVTKPFDEQVLLQTLVKQLYWEKAAPTAAPASPLDNTYDLSELRTLSRGDEAFVTSMVEVFVEQTSPALEEITDALAAKDYLTVAKTAHRIKPSIESMGIRQLDGVAKDIELRAKAETVEHQILAKQVDLLVATLDEVVRKIQGDYALT